MPGPLIGNPAGAFQESLELPTSPGNAAPQPEIRDCFNSGATAIPVNTWVALDVTGTGTHVFGIKQGLHTLDSDAAQGLAVDAIAVSGVGRVCTGGPANFIAGTAGVTAGDLLTPDLADATHDGRLITASDTPEVGEVIGRALTTTADGAVGEMWVFKA